MLLQLGEDKTDAAEVFRPRWTHEKLGGKKRPLK
jgi:hypothetical protein